jgi:hypothetical protein
LSFEREENPIEHLVHTRGVFEGATFNCTPHDIDDAQAELHDVALIGCPNQMAECELVLPPRDRSLNAQPDFIGALCSNRLGFHIRLLGIRDSRLQEAHHGQGFDV